MTLFLYGSTVLIWGTTWLAIAFQMGDVAVEVSAFYRFALAAILQVGGMILLKKLKWIKFRDHGWFVLQGMLLFCVNFLFFYNATVYITSGLISVVFSMATIFNMMNGFIIHRKIPDQQSVFGALIGLVGISFVFGADLMAENWSVPIILGLALTAGGTFCFSLGNMVSQHQQKMGRDVLTANSYALVYGALALGAWCLFNGYEFTVEYNAKYLGALFYLATIGTIIGFGAYLKLVGNIGAEKAAYATVLFPIVALTLSTVFEGYVWTPLSLIGVCLALVGNLVIFTKRSRLPKSREAA